MCSRKLEGQRSGSVLYNLCRRYIPKMEPPIQTEYLRSGGATILTYMMLKVNKGPDAITIMIQTFMLAGDSEVSSFCMRSEIPGYIVVPPDKTTLP